MYTYFKYCFLYLFLTSIACKPAVDPSHPSPPKSVDDALKSFQIEEGFEVQLVASEPMIEDPVISQFDESNRLWVVEMLSLIHI